MLGEALAERPEMTVDLERSVPTSGGAMRYLWASGGGYEAVGDALADDPTVDEVTPLTRLDGGGLFQVAWNDADGSVVSGLRNGDEAVLRAIGRDDAWFLAVRFGGRGPLSDFQTFCERQGITLTLLRLYEPRAPKLGQYDLTIRQRTALVTALEMGYFEVPRRAKLRDVADELGVTTNAVSERLRRAERAVFGGVGSSDDETR